MGLIEVLVSDGVRKEAVFVLAAFRDKPKWKW